jgi:tRNA pseudouridine55 synthase
MSLLRYKLVFMWTLFAVCGIRTGSASCFVPPAAGAGRRLARRSFGQVHGADAGRDRSDRNIERASEPVSLYRSEGIFAVNKPLDWTSSDVVSYIRGILERDARHRGAKPANLRGRNKRRIVRVGHGGTLDPLASGVLVIGVGKGTKELQNYLSGPKCYRAQGEFGFETTTLDMEGNVTKTAPFDHVSVEDLEDAINSLTGTSLQTPPIYSAIRKGGKKLYEEARKGRTADDVQIDAREVKVYKFELLDVKLPRFDVDIESGGGTYVRALIRDVGYKLNTVATTTFLQRTQQGQFTLDDALEKADWTPDNIFAAIDRINARRASEGSHDQPTRQ